MGKSVAGKIQDALDREVARHREWDGPPGLFFIYVNNGQVRLSQVPVPQQMWAQGRPPEVLTWIAGEWAAMPPQLFALVAPEGLYGVAFYCEAWMVEIPQDAEQAEQAAQMTADAEAHVLHTRQDRIETRTMWAVDRDGTFYMTVLRRDGGLVPVADSAQGTVPEALHAIVKAICR